MLHLDCDDMGRLSSCLKADCCIQSTSKPCFRAILARAQAMLQRKQDQLCNSSRIMLVYVLLMLIIPSFCSTFQCCQRTTSTPATARTAKRRRTTPASTKNRCSCSFKLNSSCLTQQLASMPVWPHKARMLPGQQVQCMPGPVALTAHTV